MKKVVKIILIIILILSAAVGAYFISYEVDKIYKNKGETILSLTYDDTETYVIPNTSVLDIEKAKEEWPYMWTIKNTGTKGGVYQILITDVETSTIKRDDLKYSLILDDKEIATGNMKDIKDNVLYIGKILGNKEQRYKLYIWNIVEHEEKDSVYEYKITLNAVEDGGPGF